MAKASKKIPWIARLNDPVYLRTIWLAVGDADGCKKLLNKKLGVEPEDMTVISHNHYGGVITFTQGKYIIWLKEFKFDASSIDTIVHEMIHLTFSVMQYVGVTLTDESEEAFAYYSGYINLPNYKANPETQMIKLNYKYIENRVNETKSRVADIVTATYHDYESKGTVPTAIKALLNTQLNDMLRDIKKEFGLK